MANLKRAYQQLFARPTDERFSTFDDLYTHCSKFKDESEVHWKHPQDVFPVNTQGKLGLKLPADQAYETMEKQSRQFTLFQAVDALTRLTGQLENAGDRAEQDVKIGRLLSLAV